MAATNSKLEYLPGSIDSCGFIWWMLLSFSEAGVFWDHWVGLGYGCILVAGFLCFETPVVVLVFFDGLWSDSLLVCSYLPFSVGPSPDSVGFCCPINDNNIINIIMIFVLCAVQCKHRFWPERWGLREEGTSHPVPAPNPYSDRHNTKTATTTIFPCLFDLTVVFSRLHENTRPQFRRS